MAGYRIQCPICGRGFSSGSAKRKEGGKFECRCEICGTKITYILRNHMPVIEQLEWKMG